MRYQRTINYLISNPKFPVTNSQDSFHLVLKVANVSHPHPLHQAFTLIFITFCMMLIYQMKFILLIPLTISLRVKKSGEQPIKLNSLKDSKDKITYYLESLFKFRSSKGWVTYRFSYAVRHNDANRMIPPPPANCIIPRIWTKSIVF